MHTPRICQVILFAALFGTMPFHLARAQDKSDAPAARTIDVVSINGEVTGGTDETLIVTDGRQEDHRVTVTEKTRVTKGGKDASLAEMKINCSVRVQAKRVSDGNLLALSIEIAGE